jgi:hypothetical protein
MVTYRTIAQGYAVYVVLVCNSGLLLMLTVDVRVYM